MAFMLAFKSLETGVFEENFPLGGNHKHLYFESARKRSGRLQGRTGIHSERSSNKKEHAQGKKERF